MQFNNAFQAQFIASNAYKLNNKIIENAFKQINDFVNTHLTNFWEFITIWPLTILLYHLSCGYDVVQS